MNQSSRESRSTGVTIKFCRKLFSFLPFIFLVLSAESRAGLFELCTTPDKACQSENSVYAKWEPKLFALSNATDDLTAATNSSNWQAYRDRMSSASSVMMELLESANAHRQASGASNIVGLYGQNLTYFFQNASLTPPKDLNDALLKINAALTGSRSSAAATAGIAIVRQSNSLGIEYIKGLASSEREAVLAAEQATQVAQGETNRELWKGTTTAGYFGGFGKRLRNMWVPFLTVLLLVTATASFVALRTRRNPLIAAIKAGLAYLLPGSVMAIAAVVTPFVSELAMVGVTLVATVAMYLVGGRPYRALASMFSGLPVVSKQFRFFGDFLDGLTDQPGSAGMMTEDGRLAMHGSARWGTGADMAAGGHLVKPSAISSLTLGRALDAPAGLDQRFRLTGHVVTVAPTGSGKGVGAVIPNLLEYPGSCLVLDIKGENAAVTARARREMGQKVYVVDPFRITNGDTHAFNLLDRLDVNDPECVSESAALADSLVITESKGENLHFDESAKNLIQGLLLHVASLAEADKRNLGELRQLLTADEESFLATLAEMADNQTVAFGVPARTANTLAGMADRERGSVLSTARRNTAFLDDPRVAEALSRSDFNLANIKTEPMTVYLVLPANKISTNSRFVRGFVGAVIAALTASATPPAHRVLFLLDEFGQLGYMKAIEDAVSLLRGYGLSFWIFIQDLSQLKGVYPKWQTFLANSAKSFFGTDDFDTAKYISDSLGQSTIEFETQNQGSNSGGSFSGGGASTNRGSSEGISQQFTARHLLTPDEVMRLGPTQAIVLVKGEYPYQLGRLNYLSDREYAGLADPNPYFI